MTFYLTEFRKETAEMPTDIFATAIESDNPYCIAVFDNEEQAVAELKTYPMPSVDTMKSNIGKTLYHSTAYGIEVYAGDEDYLQLIDYISREDV